MNILGPGRNSSLIITSYDRKNRYGHTNFDIILELSRTINKTNIDIGMIYKMNNDVNYRILFPNKLDINKDSYYAKTYYKTDQTGKILRFSKTIFSQLQNPKDISIRFFATENKNAFGNAYLTLNEIINSEYTLSSSEDITYKLMIE